MKLSLLFVRGILDTHFFSTRSTGSSISSAMWDSWTQENGSTIFAKFCSNKFSYNSFKCRWMSRSSSISEQIEVRKTNFLWCSEQWQKKKKCGILKAKSEVRTFFVFFNDQFKFFEWTFSVSVGNRSHRFEFRWSEFQGQLSIDQTCHVLRLSQKRKNQRHKTQLIDFFHETTNKWEKCYIHCLSWFYRVTCISNREKTVDCPKKCSFQMPHRNTSIYRKKWNVWLKFNTHTHTHIKLQSQSKCLFCSCLMCTLFWSLSRRHEVFQIERLIQLVVTEDSKWHWLLFVLQLVTPTKYEVWEVKCFSSLHKELNWSDKTRTERGSVCFVLLLWASFQERVECNSREDWSLREGACRPISSLHAEVCESTAMPERSLSF